MIGVRRRGSTLVIQITHRRADIGVPIHVRTFTMPATSMLSNPSDADNPVMLRDGLAYLAHMAARCLVRCVPYG